MKICYNDEMSILVSGIKPTGETHLGSYIGAMSQFLDLQDKYDSYIFVADFHALTTVQNPEKIEKNTENIILDYLAVGLDTEKVTLFKQSDVPEVTELCWIFNCITSVPYLSRAHAYKDAESKNKEVTVGTFDYPILMAADILIHDAEIVPVGTDQKQHVEYARDIASKFNRLFGETFVVPKPLILEDKGTVLGTDGKKMSKSYGNTIPLNASDEVIEKAVMSISTDSTPIEEPKKTEGDVLYQLHSFFTPQDIFVEIEKGYKEGGLGYKKSKEILIESIKEFCEPIRERRRGLEENKIEIFKSIKENGAVVREKVSKKMLDVKKKVGLSGF